MSKYILSDIFEGNYPITQKYGERPAYYKQFNLAGHEGIDFKTPIGTDILSPFDGKIIRDIDDPKSGAYGNYLVDWDQKQKCAVWFCHLSVNFVKIGDVVKKGQVLGRTGNTGNSTGPHLHFNFVETDAVGNRLNLKNGYQGFLNSLDPKLVQWVLGSSVMSDTIETVITDQTIIDLGYLGKMEVQAIKSKLRDQENTITSHNTTMISLNDQISKLTTERDSLRQQLLEAQQKPSSGPTDPNIVPVPTNLVRQLLDSLLRLLGNR